jgi:4'-phosphopantetheinyl transferase
MPDLGWLTRTVAEVPRHDRWLSEREREMLATLRVPKRLADWRLGRWAAKAAVAVWQGVSAADVEILAAADGAPEALVGGARIPIRISLSHRSGRALVVVGRGPGALGCDLEVIEARSPTFLREWLGPAERRLLNGLDGEQRDLAANLLWSAKEAASKARREGLRLNVRHATVEPAGLARSRGSWERLRVTWEEGPVERGWWRREPGWVMTVVGHPANAPPSELP